MTILIIAEHGNTELGPATLNAVTAAKAIGGEIEILVAGSGCDGAANDASKIEGVTKILVADSDEYANALAENVATLVSRSPKTIVIYLPQRRPQRKISFPVLLL